MGLDSGTGLGIGKNFFMDPFQGINCFFELILGPIDFLPNGTVCHKFGIDGDKPLVICNFFDAIGQGSASECQVIAHPFRTNVLKNGQLIPTALHPNGCILQIKTNLLKISQLAIVRIEQEPPLEEFEILSGLIEI